MKKIMPTSDLAFKKVMSSEENKDILAGLIEDFFGIKAKGLKIEKPYSIAICKEYVDQGEVSKLRETLKDVAATIEAADITAEIQLHKTKFFDERLLYYPFERYCQNYSMAEAMYRDAGGKLFRMSSLKPIYALNILGYTHFDDDEALRILELCDQKKNKRLDKEYVRIALFELEKSVFDTPNQEYWRDYFLTGNAHSNAPDYIKKASRVIQYANLSEEERNMISMMEKLEEYDHARMEYRYDEGVADGLSKGMAKGKEKGMAIGMAKGIAKGMAKGKIDVAKKLRKMGMSPQDISKVTGLTIKQLKSLQKKAK